MEGSSAPPEVLKRALGADQSDDESKNNNSGTTPFDPQGLTSQLGSQSGSGNHPTANAQEGGEGTSLTPRETLSLWDQLRLISPWGLLTSLTQQVGSESTPQQEKARQEHQQRQAALIAQNKQSFQRYESKKEQKKAALRQQIAGIKSQAAGLKHLDGGSVLRTPTNSSPSKASIPLLQKSLHDAQKAEVKKKQSLQDPGSASQKGPRSFTDTIKGKGGFQKLAEQTMGE